MANGNGAVVHRYLLYMIGVIVTLFIGATSLIGKNVITNERNNIMDHRDMRKETAGVQQSLAAQTVEIKYLSKITEKNGTTQEKILDLLQKIDNNG